MESEIDVYKESDKKDSFNIFYPMFDKLYFKGKDVDVMSDDDEFTITSKNHKTTYTIENSKMKLGLHQDEAFIINPILNINQRIIEKQIDNEKYLFINFTKDIDIAEKTPVYVYKKLKGENK